MPRRSLESQDPNYWNPDKSPLLDSKYYSPQNMYYDEDFDEDIDLEELAAVSPEAPATLTDVPTSSTNAARPRTVAAGYDERRSVLTVVFRDGTLWNYYNISPGEWQTFHSSISKGRPWLNSGGPFTRKPNGPADMTNVDAAVAAQLYNYARKMQIKYATKYKYRTERTASYKTKSGTVTKTYVTKAKRVSKTALKKAGLGFNPATANKPSKP